MREKLLKAVLMLVALIVLPGLAWSQDAPQNLTLIVAGQPVQIPIVQRNGKSYVDIDLEVMKYLRDNGYRTYIVTGGGQDFVRAYAQQVYGIPPEQIVGSALDTQYEYSEEGQGILMRDPKLLLNNNGAGRAEDIYLFIGKHPKAAFGNTDGDRQMLEYTQASGGASLEMLVLHDDATREYAYGPAQGLPDTKVGTFPQTLYDEAKAKGWTIISMKNDWKQIIAWEK